MKVVIILFVYDIKCLCKKRSYVLNHAASLFYAFYEKDAMGWWKIWISLFTENSFRLKSRWVTFITKKLNDKRRKFIHLKNKYNNILITDDEVNILYSDGQSIDSIYYYKNRWKTREWINRTLEYVTLDRIRIWWGEWKGVK